MNPADFSIQTPHQIAIAALSVMLVGLVLELVRRDLLKERYALLWLGTSLAGLAVGVFPGAITKLAMTLHFQMITTLFVLSFFYTLGIVLAFSVIISSQSERNRRLAQEVALLANRLDRLEVTQSGIHHI